MKSLLFASFVASTLGQQLVFNPPTLDLSNARDGQRITVTVPQIPATNTYVHFDTPELLRLDNCQLVFGPGRPQSQTITVRPGGSTTNTANLSLTAKLITNGNTANAPSVSYSVRPFIGAPKVCTSGGDPHYNTFDGTSYTFMGTPGQWYYMVNSLETSIQTELATCSPGTTCNKDISIRHYDGLLRVRVTSDKSATKKYSVTLSGNQDMFTVTQGDNKLEVQLLDGSSITVDFHVWNIIFSNIAVQLPATYRSRVSGLCGDYNGTPENAQASIQAGQNFIVPSGDLIVASTRPSGLAAPQTNGYRCVSATSTTPGGVSATFSRYFVQTKNLCIDPPRAGQTPSSYCTELFNPLTCAGVDKTPYLQACIADCGASGANMQTQGAASVKSYQEAVGYQARTSLAAGDISGSKTLETCGRVILTPFKMEAVVDNGRIRTIAAQGNPFAIAGVCERADGSLNIGGLGGAGSQPFGTLPTNPPVPSQNQPAQQPPTSFIPPNFQAPTFTAPQLPNFQLPNFNLPKY